MCTVSDGACGLTSAVDSTCVGSSIQIVATSVSVVPCRRPIENPSSGTTGTNSLSTLFTSMPSGSTG